MGLYLTLAEHEHVLAYRAMSHNEKVKGPCMVSKNLDLPTQQRLQVEAEGSKIEFTIQVIYGLLLLSLIYVQQCTCYLIKSTPNKFFWNVQFCSNHNLIQHHENVSERYVAICHKHKIR